MACLAQLFEQEEALDKLEGFTSLHGPAFYKLPPNQSQITLQRHEAPVSFGSHIDTEEGPVTIFDPLAPIYWDVVR